MDSFYPIREADRQEAEELKSTLFCIDWTENDQTRHLIYGITGNESRMSLNIALVPCDYIGLPPVVSGEECIAGRDEQIRYIGD